MPCQIAIENRFARGCQSSDLALMAEHAKPDGLGDDAIGEGHTPAAVRLEQRIVVTEQGGELSVAERASRIGNVVANPVRCVEQPLAPIREKQPWQGVAKMMVGPVNSYALTKTLIDKEIGLRDNPARVGHMLFPKRVDQQPMRPLLHD